MAHLALVGHCGIPAHHCQRPGEAPRTGGQSRALRLVWGVLIWLRSELRLPRVVKRQGNGGEVRTLH